MKVDSTEQKYHIYSNLKQGFPSESAWWGKALVLDSPTKLQGKGKEGVGACGCCNSDSCPELRLGPVRPTVAACPPAPLHLPSAADAPPSASFPTLLSSTAWLQLRLDFLPGTEHTETLSSAKPVRSANTAAWPGKACAVLQSRNRAQIASDSKGREGRSRDGRVEGEDAEGVGSWGRGCRKATGEEEGYVTPSGTVFLL